jgi:hypothetical protein
MVIMHPHPDPLPSRERGKLDRINVYFRVLSGGETPSERMRAFSDHRNQEGNDEEV